ncbi:MAG: 5-formyltetrahydrofolate cyclo-ligase [Negativicutes bacterium]|nr:5-formyltetrahydrofolate cyclo-ligase [Negativicutes bacterium]
MTHEAARAEKQRLRQEILEKRRSLTPEQVADGSSRIAADFCAWPVYLAANTIMIYLAMADEPQTDGLIVDALAWGKQVCVPVLTEKYGVMTAAEITGLEGLVTGRLGLKMPDPASARPVCPATIDLVVVPGVAFDSSGNRLGMGAGYYDRFLAEASNGVRLGLAWSWQLAARVPSEDFDIKMHYLLTEGGFLSCGRGGG